MKKILIQAGKGVASGYVLTIVNVIRKLIIIPLVLDFIGQSLYGVWLIIGEVMGYLRQMEGGMGFAVEQRVASVKWKNNLTKLSTIVSTGVMVFFLLSFMTVIVGLCLSPFFVRIFRIEPEYHSLVTLVFLLAVISMGLGLPLDAISSFLRGVQKQAWAINITIITSVAGFVVILLLLYNGLGLLALPISALIVVTFRYGLSWYLLRRAEKGISLSIRFVKKGIAKDLLNFSLFAFINQLSYAIVFGTDSIVIGCFLGSSQVTIYVLTFQLTLTLIGFVQGISENLKPGYTELFSQGKTEQLQKLFLDILRPVVLFSWLTALAVFFLNQEFVGLWVGPENFGGQSLTIVFSLTGVYITYRRACSALLLSSGDIRFVARWVSVEAFLNLVISLILVQTFGLLGVALGTLVAGVIAAALFLIPRIIRKIQISLGHMLKIVFLNPIAYSIPTTGIFFICTKYLFTGNSWHNFLLTGSIGGLVGLISLWYNVDLEYRNHVKLRILRSFN